MTYAMCFICRDKPFVQQRMDAFFGVYPYGRAGVWRADQGGATQPCRLRLLELGSVGELLQGRLEPKLVKLVRGTGVPAGAAESRAIRGSPD